MSQKRLLLHICCAPDLTVAYERTCDEYEVTGFFSNNCIEPRGEYFKRLEEVKKLADTMNMPLLEDEYDTEGFHRLVKGLEKEPEKGRRCRLCIKDRLMRTMDKTRSEGFDLFAATLTVSPRKDAGFINQTGAEIANKCEIEYLPSDFKKQDGFQRSVELSKKLGIYRQDYCGCCFSLKQRREQKRLKAEEAEKRIEEEKAEGVKITAVNPNMVMPPGAFFKPKDMVSRRFKEGNKHKKGYK